MPIGLKGNTDGSGAVQIGGSDAITISTGLNTTFAGTVTATGTVAGSTGTLYPLTSGTAVASTSGTALDFTSIPSWVKRITVMFNGVSTNGSSQIQIQIGAGSVVTTGYISTASYGGSSFQFGGITTGFVLEPTGSAGATIVRAGAYQLMSFGGNVWVGSGNITSGINGLVTNACAGYATALSGALDRVRITTVNGTDTFDAGSINILFE